MGLRFTDAKGTRMEKELLLLFIYYRECAAREGWVMGVRRVRLCIVVE